SACASAPAVPAPATAPLPFVALDRKVAWILRLETQRVLRDADQPARPLPVGIVPATAPDLTALVADVDAAVRRRAALAIGRVGLAEGVPALVAALSD